MRDCQCRPGHCQSERAKLWGEGGRNIQGQGHRGLLHSVAESGYLKMGYSPWDMGMEGSLPLWLIAEALCPSKAMAADRAGPVYSEHKRAHPRAAPADSRPEEMMRQRQA